MVVVGMCERNDVEPFETARPKIWRNDFLAYIRAGMIPADGFRAGLAAAIYQHRSAIGECDENRIALTDIQHIDFEFAGLKTGTERMRRY